MTRTNIRRTGDTPCVACTLTTPGVLPCSKSMTALAQGRNSGSDSITATPGFVKLEKKIKRNGLCCKLTEPMRADTVRAVISGSSWTPEGPLSQELKARMASGLLPKTIVDYTREATNFLTGSVSKCSVKSKTVRPDGVELNVEVRMKGESTGFVNALAAIPGVQSAVLVSYNGEYMG